MEAKTTKFTTPTVQMSPKVVNFEDDDKKGYHFFEKKIQGDTISTAPGDTSISDATERE